MVLAFIKKRKNTVKPEKMEGIDECTRQIIAANMTMLAGISSMQNDLIRMMRESNTQLAELKVLLTKED